MMTATSLPAPLEGRVLVLAPHHALIPILHALGLRAEAAADANAALHALIKADLALDPFRLVIGTAPQLAGSLAATHLLVQPELLAASPDMADEQHLHDAIAFAFAPRQQFEPIDIAGIDTVAGLENLGGDRAFYLKLLERFWRLHQDSLVTLMAAATAKRWDEVMRLSHSLRGSAAGVGARALQAVADEVETSIRERGEPEVGQAMALAGELGYVLAELAQYHDSGHDAGQTVAPDTTRASAALARLDVMLSEFSGESLDKFDESRASLATILPPAVLVELAAHLERYEFDAARLLLAAYVPNKI